MQKEDDRSNGAWPYTAAHGVVLRLQRRLAAGYLPIPSSQTLNP